MTWAATAVVSDWTAGRSHWCTRDSGSCTGRSTRGHGWSTSGSSRSCTSWSTSRSGTARSSRNTSGGSGTAGNIAGITAVVVVEQASLSTVQTGEGGQRGGNPNKLHCILQVHHGAEGTCELSLNQSKHRVWLFAQFEGAIRVTPIFSTIVGSSSQPFGDLFSLWPVSTTNMPIKPTLRAGPHSLD